MSRRAAVWNRSPCRDEYRDSGITRSTTGARPRAIEAGLFVVAAAQVGQHEDGRHTFGHSLVIDPWGEVLLDMGDKVGVGFADIDLKRISDVRSRIPALNHRRPIPEAVTI